MATEIEKLIMNKEQRIKTVLSLFHYSKNKKNVKNIYNKDIDT
jgi:hypothetical protein